MWALLKRVRARFIVLYRGYDGPPRNFSFSVKLFNPQSSLNHICSLGTSSSRFLCVCVFVHCRSWVSSKTEFQKQAAVQRRNPLQLPQMSALSLRWARGKCWEIALAFCLAVGKKNIHLQCKKKVHSAVVPSMEVNATKIRWALSFSWL